LTPTHSLKVEMDFWFFAQSEVWGLSSERGRPAERRYSRGYLAHFRSAFELFQLFPILYERIRARNPERQI
jgi:hypothetical protein